jgi:hypothetical protein
MLENEWIICFKGIFGAVLQFVGRSGHEEAQLVYNYNGLMRVETC